MLRIRVATALALACLVSFLAPGSHSRAASPDLVISQVYGGAGSAGAQYGNDFVEIFNRGSAPASLNGLSIQYASATGTGNFGGSTTQITELPNVTLAPGQYFLVQEAAGAGSAPLPTPDASDLSPINLSASAGKVALVSGFSSLGCNGGSTPCLQPALDRIIDLVGYGSANFFEGPAAAPTLSGTTSATRISNGCTDTDINSADFTASTPTPRNTASAFNACGGGPTPTNPSGVGTATPSSVEVESATTLTVAVTPGTNPASTGLTVTADLSSIGGSSTQAFFDDGTHGDVVAADLTFTYDATVPASVTAGAKTLPVSIADAQARTGSASIALTITAPVVAADVVISQVYGGGGNSGAVFRNDFIELYNQGDTPANLAGWSVQYASSAGTSWQVTTLSGTIPAHAYYLVQEAAGAGGTQNLPAPDAIGTIAMAAGSGKVALVAGASALSGSCPLASAVDFVGYGSANCSEGGAAAPGLTNTTAAIRAGGGAIDTNNNAADFSASTPDPHNSAGIPPVATGFATPATVTAGGTTKLTVTVTPGDLPPSTGISVTANLGAIGGSASQPFYDDGSHGDVTAGDNTFSFDTVVTGTAGIFGLPASAADAQSRTANTTIRLAIETAFTPIYTLQGIGSTSPFAGQLVTTAGVVTALKFNGFYIQVPEIESDGDASTSDGIFVFTSSAPPSFLVTGDAVRVVGTMQEYVPSVAPTQPPLTEIVGAVFGVVSRGNAIPAPVILQPSFTTPDGGREQLERFEGMRVAADIVAITGTDGGVNETEATGSSNGEFYAVIKGVARPVREPGYDPSETLPADAPCCVPAFDGNPEKLRVDSDALVGAAKIEIVAGQSLDGLTGVLDYGFFAYTILPDPGAHVPTGPAAAVPVTMPGADQFTVSSFNLERFYNNVDDPGISEPVLSPAGFERRLSKASLAIRNILRTPDVLGAIEIENLATLQALAARVNADAVAAGQPDPNYVAYLEEGNDPGGIDVGFLVKSSRVTVVSVAQIGKDTSYVRVDNGQTDLLNDRPPLVLRAEVLSDGEPYPITVIVNHLRSLNGMTDPGGAGARVRQKRRLQAEFLANYIQERQSANPNERIISVGDYNAFQFNDGWVDLIGTIEGQPTPADQVVEASVDLVNPNLVNTGDLLGGAAQYSYTFDGNAQAIDHILVNQAAYKRFTAIEYAHLDADFPESFRGDATRPERISDHDAAVAYFQFPGAPVITLVGGSEITVEAYGAAFVDPGYSAYDDDLGVVPVQVSGSVDVNTLGDYTLTYTATNGYKSATVTRLVHVVDSTAPSIADFVVAPNMLWPANHTMIPVAVAYTATDGSGIATCSLAVESNEAQNGLGDGDTDVDWLVDSPTAVQLRAERSALGTGRVYGVIVSCVDPSGNRAMQRGTVMVPLNSGGR